jgi:hypothetical protein
MAKVLTALGLTISALVALLLGPVPFSIVVIAVSLLVIVDLAQLLTRSGMRPILPVALLPGLVLPVLVAGDPDRGWGWIGDVFAGAFLLAFLVVLVFGRRRRVTAAVGATALVSLLVGLGASSLLLLRGLEDGFRWMLGLGLLAVAADVTGPLVTDLRRRQLRDDPAPPFEVEPGLLEGAVVPVASVAVVGWALTRLLAPPWDLQAAGLVGLVAVLAVVGGRYLQEALITDVGVDPNPTALRLGDGVMLATADGMLLAAPAAYVLARAAVL